MKLRQLLPPPRDQFTTKFAILVIFVLDSDPVRRYIITSKLMILINITCEVGAMRRLVLIAALGGALAAGCSKPKDEGVPVDGHVQVNGKPAAGAIVTFHPVNAAADAPHPSGQVAEDGSLKIPAAEPGEYRVTVAWYSVNARKGVYADESVVVSQLPAAYTRPDATPLKATIAAGQPVTLDIKKK
jgi:hypothetical protein